LATAPPLEAAKPKRLANLSAANRKSREEAEARLAEALRRLQARGSGLACAPKEAKVGHRKAAEWLRRMRS
jgi:16S rRNA G1207 methylase RsmC